MNISGPVAIFPVMMICPAMIFQSESSLVHGGGVWPAFVTVKINGSGLDTLGPPGVGNIYLFATRTSQSAKTQNFSGTIIDRDKKSTLKVSQLHKTWKKTEPGSDY